MTETDDTIKKIAAREFARAGAWAILSLILIIGLGYQAHWFLTRFVNTTEETMKALVASTVITQQLIRESHVALQENTEITEHIVDLMTDAQRTMHEVPNERKKQTALLEEIKELLEARPKPNNN